MAMLEVNKEGLFGAPTATIDWCEANYEVTRYIAEFWNTLSNVFMVLPPLIGAFVAFADGLEIQFVACHLMIMLVGIGSTFFHGTLLYGMQLLDELPMIYGSAFLIYTLVEFDSKFHKKNTPLIVGLLVYCLVVTVTAYALMVFTIIGGAIRIVRRHRTLLGMFIGQFVLYGIGFLLWNLDNNFCSQFRLMRHKTGYPLKPLLQGHAWWHILAGVSTYSTLIFVVHARCKHLELPCHVEVKMGCVPVLRVKTHNG